jgi:hypothetical protein
VDSRFPLRFLRKSRSDTVHWVGKSMTSEEIGVWASAYIEIQQDQKRWNADDPLWWSVERFLVRYSMAAQPEDCWRAILEVLRRRPPDCVINVLAAGPLEDLIDKCGPEFIDRIEAEARGDPAFRHLLGGVWKSSTDAVWARVEKARGKMRW